MQFKKWFASTALTAAVVGGVGVAATPAVGADMGANACVMYALVPDDLGSQNLRAKGGRGACSTPATVNVQIKHVINNWPDTIIASSTRNAIYNATWYVYGVGGSGDSYYTHTVSSTGASATSGSMRLD